jgi:hypothetical protein
MSDPNAPAHRALLALVASRAHLAAIDRALGVLDRRATVAGIVALRAEVRDQLARLERLLDLLVEAELRDLQDAPKVV